MPQWCEARLDGPPRQYMLDGEVYELTGSWRPLMDHLGRGEWRWPLLLDLTHPDDAAVLRERLGDPSDDLALSDVRGIAERLVLAATGQMHFVAERLLLAAQQQWMELDGDLTRGGADLAVLIDRQPARACNTIYAWMVAGADPKEREKFDVLLRQPPLDLGEAAAQEASTWFAEQEGASFTALMGVADRAGATPSSRAAGTARGPGA